MVLGLLLLFFLIGLYVVSLLQKINERLQTIQNQEFNSAWYNEK